MMPVLNKPFMAHVVNHLMKHGVDEVILTRGHLAGQMERYFGDGAGMGLKITYVDENRPLGTAGGIKNCERYLDGPFFALNGDIFSTIDLTAMLQAHREKGAVATIALTPVDNPAAFGLVETEGDGRIRRFIEKPKPDEATTNMVNAGCYILEPEVLGYIKPDTNTSIERETFQLLLKDRRPFYAWSDRDAYWIDMGNRDKYFQLNMDILAGRCRCALTLPPGIHLGDGVVIDGTARLTGNVVIGKECRVGAGTTLSGPVVLGDGCCVGENAVIGNSIIWSGVNFGEGAVITDSIIAGNCRISPRNRITASSLADGVYTPPGLILTASQIWPGTVLSN
jgi:mannose-1-phosphate guanylyltransferase